ncbi:pectin acetylesterase-family hydrolase [Lysobacter sp. Hz 25]|uniref:pectin acetylesterase-family hydrolase n=1 Tax=Lysobacter sp. Hz 25 TaxID=3383698 RepID=UPI0038D4BB0C
MALSRHVAVALLGGAVALSSLPSHAEQGDYGFFETIRNLFSPPKADNKVQPAQRSGQYPLLSRDAARADGFDPGAYYQWQTVQLPAETGAVCGNGSPYKIFVNRVPDTTNTIIYMEGGGACWDYASCSGQGGVRGARNPNGVPDDYMKLLNPGASLVSPFVTRVSPFDGVKTQGWNMVYVPYCTGDLYGGDKVAVYNDPSGQAQPLVWHHNGLRNSRALTAWLKDNLPRPGQMLSTGCSAGGAGSLINYDPLRRDLAPSRAFLIDDSGPIFPTPRNGDPAQYPSQPLMAHIRGAWGLDAPNGPLAYLASGLPQLDLDELGSIYPALANKHGNDRLGATHFWQDLNYSSYSYERFHDDIQSAPNQAAKEALIHAKWGSDTQRLSERLNGLDNFGGYFPQYRALNESHCTTIVDFKNGDVQEQSLELKHFIDSVLDGSGKVRDASEQNDSRDKAKPFNLLYWLVDQLLA